MCLFQAQGDSSSEVPCSWSEAETRPSTVPSPARLSSTPALFRILDWFDVDWFFFFIPLSQDEAGVSVASLMVILISSFLLKNYNKPFWMENVFIVWIWMCIYVEIIKHLKYYTVVCLMNCETTECCNSLRCEFMNLIVCILFTFSELFCCHLLWCWMEISHISII